MSCRLHGFPWLSLVTRLYRPSLLVSLLGYILCLHRAAVDKFQVVVHHLRVRVKGSIGSHRLWVRPYFTSSVLNVLFIRLGWFYRWEAGGRTVAASWDVALGICSLKFAAFLCNCCQTFSLYVFLVSTRCIRIEVDYVILYRKYQNPGMFMGFTLLYF